MTALSVSTSASTSPTAIASPVFFFHSTSRPSSIVGDSASITTLVAMLSVPVADLVDGRGDLRRVRFGGLLEVLVVRHRYIGLVYPDDRRIQCIKGLTLDHINHFGADAREAPPLLGDHDAIRAGDRCQDRFVIER